jgi:phosphoenolpyruvate synthase/pyruvate phosphate dikinase
VCTLAEAAHRDVQAVGHEAQRLGRRIAAGLTERPGFVLTTGLHVAALTAAGVSSALADLQARAGAADAPVLRTELCARMAPLMRTAAMSEPVVAAVRSAYPALGIEGFGPARVVVRPSVREEDAGPEVSAEVVRGLPALLERVGACWASLADPARVAARAEHGQPGPPTAAVIVQAAPRRSDG